MTRVRYYLDAAKVYAQLGYVIVAGVVGTVATPICEVLEQRRHRPDVCIHGWLVLTRPGQAGACPVCERRVP